MKERCLLPQLVTVANGTAHNASLNITATFIARHHAIADQERSSANVICNDAQRFVLQIGTASFSRRCFDQCIKNIDFIVAVNVLQNGSQTLEAHASVNARRRQILHAAIRLHVKLHEHVVPNFNVAVAVLLGAARRAARNFRAVVVEDFGARAARAGVGHHPEIVGHVASAFVVANTHDALGRESNFFRPNVVGLVIFYVDRGP